MLKLITFLLLFGLSGSAFAICGDTSTDSGEQCDDGNTLDGDGCSATCQVECGFLQSGFTNGSFEFPQQPSGTRTEHDQDLVPAWFSIRRNQPLIEIIGADAVPAVQGNNYASLNINKRTGVYQYLDVVPGVRIDWSVWHRAEVQSNEKIRVRINDKTQARAFGSLTQWQEVSGQYTVPQGVYRIKFAIEARSPRNSDFGNLIDDASISYPDISSMSNCSSTPTILHQSHTNGRVVVLGNSSLSCEDSDPDCADARSFTGAEIENNDFDMTYVDVDGLSSTENSSNVELDLNPGETVAWAGLVWSGGFTDFGNPAKYTEPTDPADRNRVTLGRTDSTANFSSDLTGTTEELEGNLYRGFVDVTSQVDRSGRYWVSNLQLTQGRGMFGGWTLIVVTNDSSLPSRSRTVAQLPFSRHRDRLRMRVPNFAQTYDPGASMEFGYIGWDGDPGATDFIFLNNNLLTPSASSLPNAPWDVSNSTISHQGANVSRQPSHQNNFGTDVKTFDGTDYLFGHTDIEVEFVTPGDQMLTGLMTFQTDLPSSQSSPSNQGAPVPPFAGSPTLPADADPRDFLNLLGCSTGTTGSSSWGVFVLLGMLAYGRRRNKTNRR